jgi:hypothetical protein
MAASCGHSYGGGTLQRVYETVGVSTTKNYFGRKGQWGVCFLSWCLSLHIWQVLLIYVLFLAILSPAYCGTWTSHKSRNHHRLIASLLNIWQWWLHWTSYLLGAGVLFGPSFSKLLMLHIAVESSSMQVWPLLFKFRAGFLFSCLLIGFSYTIVLTISGHLAVFSTLTKTFEDVFFASSGSMKF